MAGKLPETWHEALAALKAEIADDKPKMATRIAARRRWKRWCRRCRS